MIENHHPFQRLTPSLVMDAVESQGYRCDSRIFALNSYENRVYQVGIDTHCRLLPNFTARSAGVNSKFWKNTASVLSWSNMNCRLLHR